MSSSRRSRSRRWKQVLANLFVGFLAVVTLLLLVGLFLPRHYRVERSIEWTGATDSVYPKLADLRRWPEWTPWNKEMDPTVEFVFEGPATGVGASYRWEGKRLGRGQLKLTKAEPGKGIWYDLSFEAGQFVSTGSITIESEGQGRRLVWVNEGELGKSPVNRYLGLMMDRMMGADFEKGLAALRPTPGVVVTNR